MPGQATRTATGTGRRGNSRPAPLASEARFRALFENSADIIALLDGTLLVRYVNQGLARTLGYSPAECIGRPLSDYAHAEDQAALEILRTRAEQQRGSPHSASLRLISRGGEPRHFDLVLANHLDNPTLGLLVCNARDVTEQRRLQARLQLSDRMASIGTLAAGVAHEINNPLAVVVGNLEVLTGRLARQTAASDLGPAATEVDELLRDAREAAERVRVTVRDLKLFSRGETAHRGLVELRPLLETSLRLARNELRHHARVTTQFGEVPLVIANEARLGQAFINLIVNAAQAIPEGHAEDNEIRIATTTDPEGRAAIEVSDSGPGVAPEILARVFDPFFNSRSPSVAAGLGLAICHEIVSEHGGRISVDSHLGFGTTFRVSLPPAPLDAQPAAANPGWSAEAASAPRPASSHPPGPPTAGAPRRRVLVIDDEPIIGSLLRRVLGNRYDVSTESLAEGALARLSQGARFDAILCDLMMPQMSGMDLFRGIERLDADQARRVIFMTGGAFTPNAQAFLRTSPNRCIDKPIDARFLRTLIDEMV